MSPERSRGILHRDGEGQDGSSPEHWGDSGSPQSTPLGSSASLRLFRKDAGGAPRLGHGRRGVLVGQRWEEAARQHQARLLWQRTASMWAALPPAPVLPRRTPRATGPASCTTPNSNEGLPPPPGPSGSLCPPSLLPPELLGEPASLFRVPRGLGPCGHRLATSVDRV